MSTEAPTAALAALEAEGIVSLWKTDTTGRLLSTSGTLADVVGHAPLAWLSEAPLPRGIAMPATSATKLREAVEGRLAFKDVRILFKDQGGHRRVLSFSGVPTADPSGHPTGFSGLATDVTTFALAGDVVALIGQSVGRRAGQDFLDGLVRALAEWLQLDTVFVARLDAPRESRAVAIAVWHDGAARDAFSYDIDHSPCRAVIETGALCIQDGAGARYTQPAPTIIGAAGYVGVPLHIGPDRKPGGILAGISRRAIADRHLALDCLSRFAERSALEVDRRDVLAAARERDRRNLALLDAIRDLWQATLESRPFRSHIQRILEMAAAALQTGRAFVWRVDQDGRHIESLGRHRGGTAPRKSDPPETAARHPAFVAAILERRILAVSDVNEEPLFDEIRHTSLAPHGITATLDVRISGGTEDVGILCFEHTGAPRVWTAEEIAFASSVADLVALVVVNHKLDGTARELAHRTEQLTLAQKVARIGHWVVRVGEETMTLSPEAGRLLGLPSDTPVARERVMACFSEAEVQRYLEKRTQLLLSGTPFEIEALARPPDAPPVWVRVSLRPIHAPDGSIETVFGTIQDIDDRKQAEMRLSESQEQLAEAQRIARLGYFRSDLSAGMVHWSDLLVEMTSSGSEVLTHDEVDRLFDPDGWAEFLTRRQESLTTGEPFTGRMRVAAVERWITYRGLPRFDSAGKPTAIFGIVQDITDQVRLEQERARADAFLRNLVEHASVAITVKDVRGKILLANAALRRQLGIEDVDVVGVSFATMMAKAGYSHRTAIIAAEDREILEAGLPLEFTHRLTMRNGKERDFHAIKFPIRDDTGAIIAVGTLRNDITELKDAQRALEAANEHLEGEVEARTRALRESEERYREIASSASDWLYEMDRSLRITSYSSGFERATGLSPESILGLSFDDTRPDPSVVGEDGLATWHKVRELLMDRQPFRDVEYWRRDSSGHRYVRVSARPRFEAGEFSGYRGCASDITALAEARRKLAESDRLASLGRLVAGIAHELNTPIGSSLTVATTLQGSVDPLVRRYRDDAMTEEAFLEFLHRVRTGAGLISGNLAQAGELVRRFKQVSVDQTSHVRRCFDLAELVDNNLAALMPSVGPSKVEVRNDVPRDLLLDSYPGPLGQAVVNLVQNAFTHAFEDRSGGEIRITAAAAGVDAIRICIADDGVGMTEEVRKRLFEPFFTTRLGRGGSGLGMNIVYNIVTRVLGGTIRVDADEKTGTTVHLDLPRTAPRPPAERSSSP